MGGVMPSTQRLFVAALLVVGCAATSNAVTLTVAPDKPTYQIGETITLTVTADDEGAYHYSIFGRLQYSGALVDNGTRTQTPLVGHLDPSAFPWLTLDLESGDDGVDAYSDAFNQLNFVGLTALNLPGDLSVVTLIARAVGVVEVSWAELNFFESFAAPGTSFAIVPEPATAALLGLGLLVVAGRARVRSGS
jgi:PEP-CTERM motif